MAKKQTKEKQELIVLELRKETLKIKIKGLTPLLMCKMDMFALKQLDNKRNSKAVEKDSRTDKQKFNDKILKDSNGNVCLPAETFYKGMIFVAPYLDGLNMKLVRGSIRIMQPMIPIKFEGKMKVHETWGRDAGRVKAPKTITRPMFENWSTEFDVTYNASNISAEQIINLVNWAGFQSGAGSWRPEKGGIYGQYEVTK